MSEHVEVTSVNRGFSEAEQLGVLLEKKAVPTVSPPALLTASEGMIHGPSKL